MDQDKTSKPTKRRARGYDNNENQHSLRGFQPAQNRFQPANVMHSDGPFSFQSTRGGYRPIRNNASQYPGQQVFLQHQPFGGHNRIPFHSFNHRPPMRYPLYHPQNQPYFYGPGGPMANQPGGNYFEEPFRPNQRAEGFGNRNYQKGNQGARPKTFKYDRGGWQSRSRKNRNNSSNKGNLRDSNNSKQSVSSNKQTVESDNTSKEALVANISVEDNTKVTYNPIEGNLDEVQNSSPPIDDINREMSGLEGAIGGVDLADEADNAAGGVPSPVDKNLIDEGAICDFDKLFQRQENLLSSGDTGDYFDDFDDCDRNFLSSQEQENEDSDLENCEFRLRTEAMNDVNVLPEPHSLKSYCYNTHSKDKGAVAAKLDMKCESHCVFKSGMDRVHREERPGQNGDNLSDTEDTGDFIDTDLPLNNKHILSSSEDTSSSDNDEQEQFEESFSSCGKLSKLRDSKLPDYNCNDLSMNDGSHFNEASPLSSSQSRSLKDDWFSPRGNERPCSSSYRYSAFAQATATANSQNKILNNSGCKNSGLDQDSCPPRPNSMVYRSEQVRLDGSGVAQLRENNDSLPFQILASDVRQDRFGSDVRQDRFGSDSSDSAGSEASFDLESHSPDNVDSYDTTDSCSCYSQPLVENNLNAAQLHSSGLMASCNVSGAALCSNFNHDESNRHKKVFVKFPVAANMQEKPESASSSKESDSISSKPGHVFPHEADNWCPSGDGRGEADVSPSELSDKVDIVFLPMEEEIEPVHAMLARRQDGDDTAATRQIGLFSSSGSSSSSLRHDDLSHLVPQDQNPLASGMPSKEFYELIKTVSTTENCIRFYDKDGLDIQRQPESEIEEVDGSKVERLKVDKVMIWNEYEAYVMQYKQIAESACGPTAVLNVMKALQIPCDKAALDNAIVTNKRNKDADIPDYLFSRACAGTMAEDLMAGVEKLSQGSVGGRFFHFWPPRKVKLLQWLAHWMNKGGIPVATLNLQQGPHSLWQVPDSWHHQMIYGVSPQGLYLTNPLEIVSERTALQQVCSDSILKVKRQDVISRFRDTTDLRPLLSHPDPRWRTMNVLGQVVNVLREFNLPTVPGYRIQVTSHINIPAAYKAGITLFMPKTASGWKSLVEAPELPLE